MVSIGYNCLHKLSFSDDSTLFGLPQHYGQPQPPFRQNFSSFDRGFSPRFPLTFPKFYGIFSLDKSCDEDTRSRKDSQRGCRMVQGFRNPAGNDTTSEPQGRNALPGAPVNASMSDGLTAVTRVEPWNTFVSHP